MNLACHRVLIVDKSAENREVLRTILSRDGVETFEANGAEQGLAMAKCCHPNVMVLDADTLELNDRDVCKDFQSEALAENAAVVVLGRIPGSAGNLSANEVLTKPYHYGPLIHKIEELLRCEVPPT